MSQLTDLHTHLRAFTAAARKHPATGVFKLGSMTAVLQAGKKQVEFAAQYLTRRPDGGITYCMSFEDGTAGFAGWLPYFNKRWPEASDKLAFKARCAAEGLPVLAWSQGRVEGSVLGDFLVKVAQGGSFGRGIHGPYAALQAPEVVLQAGEYAERFVSGQIGKAWYWNDAVVGLELRPPAFVVGDGVSTLAQLARRQRLGADVETVTDFLRYRRLEWACVPAEGERVEVDYRYASVFEYFHTGSTDRLAELAGSPLVAQLNAWGPAFWSFVPPSIRPGTLYTVDFVLDGAAQIHLLEMNCNPTVPPEAYDTIVADALSPSSVQPPLPPEVSAGTLRTVASLELLTLPPHSAFRSTP